MTVERTDLFHCLVCGKIAYHPHGTLAPACCGQPMIRAVSDVVKDLSPGQPASAPKRSDVELCPLLAETGEIANWCRCVEDTGAARYEQLAQRLQALHDALCDRFDLEEQEGELSQVRAAAVRYRDEVLRLRAEHRQILLVLDRFVADLRQGESCFRGWAEVCERLDSLAADLRRHEEAQDNLAQMATQEDSTLRK